MGMAQTQSELGSFVGLIRAMEKSYSDFRKEEYDKRQREQKKGKKHGSA